MKIYVNKAWHIICWKRFLPIFFKTTPRDKLFEDNLKKIHTGKVLPGRFEKNFFCENSKFVKNIYIYILHDSSRQNFIQKISIIRFIIPIQSDKIVYAKIYGRSFLSFPRENPINSSSFIGARTHFVHSGILAKRFRHVAKSRDVVVIIVIGAYAERRSRATGIPLYQASFILGKQYICCTVFSINLLNVPKKDRSFIFVYSS